ncbi:VOC family protein [Desertivirga xinjiangensis]|uniref:VOC family protein n=1 Tax=Desertivirga xinjiangensis TaxID=539206 RepID=UPI00210B19E7|nr:VOC family protein [Pedobacter xinjiangensis]
MIRKIATQAVYVTDQNKALEFWTEKMDFELRKNEDMGIGFKWIEVAPKGAETSVVLYPRKIMKDWNERKSSIVFLCEDIEDFYMYMKSQGIRFKQELNEMPWGKFAVFLDDDDNEFVLKG